MNKEDNNILIKVLNSNGDIELTKLINPDALWRNHNYPDEYIFKEVVYVNIFTLIQEKDDLLVRIEKAIKLLECSKNMFAEIALNILKGRYK